MRKSSQQNQRHPNAAAASGKNIQMRTWMRTAMRGSAVAIAMAAFALTANPRPQQIQAQSGPDRPLLLPQANRIPDANAQMDLHEKENRDKAFKALNLERSKQIADDSARLLKLATDLKAEVDKTSKDTLSINVIRKADEIEKLAHAVREKMKLEFAN
jgi:hypothetical protein